MLREALAREEALLRKKDELIQQQQVLSKEADHRLLNGLQMIVSLLRLQGLALSDTEAASQLLIAANCVAAIERVHRRLHYLDGIQSVSFKQYLDDLCRDFSTMFASGERQERVIAVEGVEIKLPTVTAIPLGFIVNELITNAVKYGEAASRSVWKLTPGRHALSVSNDGPALPDDLIQPLAQGWG